MMQTSGIRRHAARALLSALICVSSTSCSVVYDGPFEQVSGNPIDVEQLRSLESEHADIDRVIGRLGPPSDRRANAGNDVLIYRSVQARMSKEETMGITISSSTQEVIQTWELEFERGSLARTRSSSRIVDH